MHTHAGKPGISLDPILSYKSMHAYVNLHYERLHSRTKSQFSLCLLYLRQNMSCVNLSNAL